MQDLTYVTFCGLYCKLCDNLARIPLQASNLHKTLQKGGWEYFDADTGAMGLYGFMEGEELQPGVAELPEEDLALVRETLDKMLKGEFTRFDVFKGPITDNQGNVVLEEGQSLEQLDLDGFSQFGSECKTCMYWWNENITAELPELE